MASISNSLVHLSFLSSGVIGRKGHFSDQVCHTEISIGQCRGIKVWDERSSLRGVKRRVVLYFHGNGLDVYARERIALYERLVLSKSLDSAHNGNHDRSARLNEPPSVASSDTRVATIVLAFDPPGYGSSKGSSDPEELCEAASQFIEYAANLCSSLRFNHECECEFLIWAHSLGCSISMRGLAKYWGKVHSDAASAYPLSGVVLEGALDKIKSVTVPWLPRFMNWLPRAAVSSVSDFYDVDSALTAVLGYAQFAAAARQLRILFLHGEKDEIAPVKCSEILHEHCRSLGSVKDVRVVQVPNGTHNELATNDVSWAVVSEALTRWW